jgi:hypothetical protein
MIFHWIKWDFKMFRAQWVIFGLIFGVMSVAVHSHESIAFQGMLTFMFAIIPASKLIGAKFRSQHVMSRSYLLSLPRPRLEIYLMLLLRLQVFAVPFMAYLICLPRMGVGPPLSADLMLLDQRLLMLLVPVVSVWLSAMQVSTQISIETISSYLTLVQRFFAWTLHVVVSVVEFLLVVGLFGYAVLYFRLSAVNAVLASVVVVAIAMLRVFLSYRRWIRV